MTASTTAATDLSVNQIVLLAHRQAGLLHYAQGLDNARGNNARLLLSILPGAIAAALQRHVPHWTGTAVEAQGGEVTLVSMGPAAAQAARLQDERPGAGTYRWRHRVSAGAEWAAGQ